MIKKIVPKYITDSCSWCHHSSGLETHSEDYASCNHPQFNKLSDGKLFDDTSGDIPDWCPLEDVKE
jgi:hypothetical protein